MLEDEFETENLNHSQKKILLTIPKHNNTRYIYPLTQFIPKVTIEDYRSKRDLMYLLKTSLDENNYPEDYTIDESDNKIVVSFDNEDAAMCFAKKLNLEKMKNISYKETKVTLTLVPNENYVQQRPIKKKGLPLDSIERLFKGETLFNKSNNNNSKRIKKFRKVYVSRDSPNYQNDVVEFGVPYSRLEKLRKKNINKSTEIFPRNFKFREIHKESWVSPTNFIV